MKLYIHGPREGQTIKLNGVQFIDGVAEHPILLRNLERYYNVKDYPPESVQESSMSINNEQQENMNINIETIDAESIREDQQLLKEVIKSKKEELSKEKPTTKEWKSMPWFTMKSYVKEMTGKSPKNKKAAIALMKEAGFE